MTDDTRKQIIKKIKKARIDQGLSQVQLANKSGVSIGGYIKIEHGDRKPQLETLEKLIKALGFKSSDVLPF